MCFEAAAVALIGCAEKDYSRNEGSGRRCIAGTFYRSALRQFEAELVDYGLAQCRAERPIEAVVADEGGASRRPVREIVVIECVVDVASIGEGVPQHHRLARR